jgi:hypothetical protein
MLPDWVCLHHKTIMHELSKRLAELVERMERDFVRFSDADTVQPVISGGWSRKQILGHLIDSASNNHQRFVRALLQDELRWPNYEQEGCVRVQRYQDMAWRDLAAFWAATIDCSRTCWRVCRMPSARRRALSASIL